MNQSARDAPDAARSVFPGFADLGDDVGALVEHLADVRRARGLSQTEVAERMRTSQPAVARLEAGRGDLRLSTLRRYAEALGHTIQFGVTPIDVRSRDAQQPATAAGDPPAGTPHTAAPARDPAAGATRRLPGRPIRDRRRQ